MMLPWLANWPVQVTRAPAFDVGPNIGQARRFPLCIFPLPVWNVISAAFITILSFEASTFSEVSTFSSVLRLNYGRQCCA
jgi:hypothetical protein